MHKNRQLAVIGAGPGGYVAAFVAADLGIKTTLIDPRSNPGGVCLYEGCIPSKTLLHASKILKEVEAAAKWGLEFQKPKIHVDRLRAWKGKVVQQLTSGVGSLSKGRQIEHIRGQARFQDANSLIIQTTDGESKLHFEQAIIASGSEPIRLPFLPQSKRIIDSSGALDLPDIPKRLLVIGGGYIGLEMSTVYASLGSKVTLVEMEERLLPVVDGDLVEPLVKRLEGLLAEMHLQTRVVKAEERRSDILVTMERQGKSIEKAFDKILVSTGRRPVTEGLGLENTAIRLAEGGFIAVDQQMRTSEKNIYAIGDVAGQPMLAHKASHEGRVAAEAASGRKTAFEPNAIPAVVFTDPEIAYCGLMEEEAKRQGVNVKVARFPWSASGRAITLGETVGYTKLIFDAESGRILGMGVTGNGAGELISEGVLAIEMGALAQDVALSIHPHPTLSETVMETAEAFFGHSTHLLRAKKQ